MKLRDPELCPRCLKRGEVIDSRRRIGYRRRMYLCRACDVRWPAFLTTIDPKRLLELPPEPAKASS